jgi:cell division protein FtsB
MILLDNPILFIIIIILIALSIVSIVFATISYGKYDDLKKRYDIFMKGRDAETLEEYFIDLQKDIDYLVEDNNKNKESIRKLNRITKRSFQKLGFYRYDAFEEKSGKRSFALAMLDFTNSGFVVTCQSLGDGTIIFIKDVDVGTTTTKLGPEEEKALEIALGQRDKYEDK